MVDKLLVIRCKRGSRDALRQIYEKYTSDLLVLAIALSHDVSLAEDAVHDVFLAFAQNVAGFKLTGSLKAYLARCVANRVRDLMRANRSRAKALSPEQACSVERGLNEPNRLIALNEELRLLSSAMAELPHEQREVIALHICGQMRFRAIENPSRFSVAIHDARVNKCLLLNPNTKMAMINTGEGYPGHKINAYKGLKRDFRDGTEKNLGPVKLNGRDTICFEITKANKKITVWADPVTALPIQIEEISDENGKRRRILRSDIKFDVEFDEQVFSMTPPAGYSLLDFETQRIQTPFELTEKHLIEGLAVYPKYLDGRFRTRFMGGRPMTDELRKKLDEDVEKVSWSDEEGNKSILACEFIERLPEGSDYQYVGEDVKLGDADTPVCWWKPPGSKTYRVIYGDLSVRDIEPSDLPEIPWLNKKK